MTTVKKFEKAEETERREGQIQDFVSALTTEKIRTQLSLKSALVTPGGFTLPR